VLTLVIKFIDQAQEKIGRFCSFAIVVMTFLGAMNAMLRYSSRFIGFNLSSNAYLESQWYLFGFVFLFAAPYTLVQNRHVRVDVIFGRLSNRSQQIINLVGHIFLLLPFCVFGVWASYDFAIDSWLIREMSPDAGGLPRYIVKIIVPIAFLLLGIQSLAEIGRSYQKIGFKGESNER
jgi:TRAP-type mannitol/chloroaromatic compound transport system permease small subunit